MRRVGVNLNDQFVGGPEEIDHVRPDAHIHLRPGKAMATADTQEVRLSVAPGVVGVEAVIERQLQILRLSQCARELRLGKGAAEVGQRSGWGRYGDAGSPRNPAGEEAAGPMDADPGGRARSQER